MKRKILPIVLFQLSLLANAQTPPYQDSRESIDTILENAIGDGIPGLSMAIANRNGLLWTSTAGYADVRSRVPVTTNVITTRHQNFNAMPACMTTFLKCRLAL